MKFGFLFINSVLVDAFNYRNSTNQIKSSTK